MLTEIECKNAKAQESLYRLKDGKGLYLEVKPNGVKAWRYRFEYVHEGKCKESMFAIGEYAKNVSGKKETEEQAQARRAGGNFTLAEARQERNRARALVKQGINPAHNRQLDRIKRENEFANTFEIMGRKWIALRDWEEITKKRRLDMLERVVFPLIGNLPVGQIKSIQILDVLTKANDKNGSSVKDEAQRTMSGIFDFAIANLMAEANPVYPVRKALPPNKTQHKRPLKKEEIGEFLRDLVGYERNFQVVSAFKLMWLTLCRPNEIVGARWDEIDLNEAIWSIPAPEMKGRKKHDVPLPRQALEVLKGMKEFTGHRSFVFPHRDKRDTHMTDNALRQALKNMGWSKRYSPHATRTTGSTLLNGMGFNGDWIERQLAHVEPNAVRRTYNHADHLEDRKKMMQQWADMLDLWMADKDSKVIMLDQSNRKRA
ncbi:MAG: tyrosine-type recombinase/integrase [Alphaproteobacteria bacterium]